MMLETCDLQAMRECCRDDAAFEQLQGIVAKYLPLPTTPAPSTRQIWYEAILQALPDRVFLVNRNGDSLDFKGTPEDAAHGFSRETIVGTNLREYLPDDLAQRCLDAIARTLDTGELQTLEYELPNAWEAEDAEPRAYEVRLVMSGESEVLGIERDITDRKRAEEALREREYRYRSLYNNTPAMLQSIDRHGCLISVSEHWLSSLGYTRSEVLGRKSVELMTPASRHYAETVVLPEYFKIGACTDVPYQFVKRNGEIMDVLLSAIAERDAEGCIIRSLAVVTDVTARKQAEQASERERRLFAEGSVVVFRWLAQTGFPVEYVSANIAQYGYEPEDFLSGRLLYGDIIYPDDVARVAAEVEASSAAKRTAIEQDYRIVRADGDVRWVYDFCSLIYDQQGHLTHYEGYILDITERKRSEQALRESEEKFSIVFRCSPTAMTLTTLDAASLARVIDVNDSFLQVTGYQKEEVIGLTVADLNVWVDLAARTRMLQILQESGSVRNLEMKFRRKSGEIGVALLSAEVVRLQGVSCLLTVTIDITDRKRTEEALQVSEGRNLAFLNAIPDMMFRIRRDGVYLDCKADQESDFVIAPSNMIGRTVYEVLPPEIARQRMSYVERTLATGEIQIFEYQLLNHGELRDYEARLVISGKDEVLAIVRNITQRKRAIAQLQASAERDRLLGLIALRIRRSLNLDQILTTTVAEVRQFLKVDRVFIGQIDAAWQGKIVAESAAPEWGSILTWIVDDLYLREIRALFAQGQVQAIDDTATARLSPLLAAYYTQCHIKASIGVPIILGDDFFGVLVANQCDQPRHWTTFEIQLLEQLAVQVAIAIQQAELYQQVQTLAANLEQQVQERTAQLQQNMQELQELSQTKDEFLNAVSHDLRTPIMGTMMVLKNLQNKAGDSIIMSRSVLDRMVQSSDRQLKMINSLLEAHSSETWGINLHCEKLPLHPLVQTVADDLDPLLVENQATLTNQISPDLPLVMADPALIRRVFENLLTNALKHNPPGLNLTVKATVEDELVRCNVQDNGVGMTPDECDSLFERYARGPRARRSTGIGLGLYLCRQIITAHGGQIGAISAPGEGATFWFTLPQA
ncbi:MAG: PAS domain S-box protein [Leptolyngbya sp. BL-A-14]